MAFKIRKPLNAKCFKGSVFLLILLCMLFQAACSGQVRHAAPALPRPGPGHLGWLTRQSMLRQADEYVKQVSQTELVWLHSGSNERMELLLEAAPNWLLNDLGKSGGKDTFQKMKAKIASLPSLGFGGLFLGDISEPQDIFLKSPQAAGNSAYPASLELDPALGGESQFEALAGAAERARVELGADLLSAATAQGPDFILQARRVTGYEGLYGMLPVPEKFWSCLPEAREEWDIAPLEQEQARILAREGILPENLNRDAFKANVPAGWAATGPVTGADGVPRRWVYRYEESPDNAVLLWQDPSGLARKTLGASIIARTGLCGLTLAGLRLAPLQGLEPATDAPSERSNARALYAPFLEALRDLSAQIRRYGGWSLQADRIEERLLRLSLLADCDFCRDDVVEAFFRWAFVTGDPEPLARLLRERLAQNIDSRRLARGLNGRQPLPSFLFPALTVDEAGLGQAEPGTDERAHILFKYWSAGLPGLVFIELQDDPDLEMPDRQPERNRLFSLLEARKGSRLALGKIGAVFQGEHSLGVISTLPDGNAWFAGVNFGKKPEWLSFSSSSAYKNFRNVDSAGVNSAKHEISGRQIRIFLDAGEALNIIFSKDLQP